MTASFRTRSAPGALPVLGHALPLGRAPLRFLASLPTHGDIVQIRLGPRPAYVVCHPDLVHRVLTDDRTFDKGGPFIDAFRSVVGDGLGTCPHRQHRQRRRLLQPAFHRERLAGHAAVMTERITTAIEPWRDGQIVDVPAAMHELAMGIVTRALFAAGTSAAEVTEIQRCINAILAGVARRVMLPIPALHRIPTPHNIRFNRARRRVRQLTGQLVDRYREAGVDHGDVLSLLLTEDAGLTDTEIHDEVVQFFLAGIEASSPLLSWIWLLLDSHPEIQARLHTEVDTVLGGRAARYDDLPRLDLTTRIVTETLRLYPPGWLMTRATTARVDLGGHRIPAGATVIYSPYLAGRRVTDFPGPDRFDPDRWPATSPARGTFVPFGGGARKCIGDTFAVTQASLAVATIAARWRLHAVPGIRTDPVARAVLAPRPLPMLIRRRMVATPRQNDGDGHATSS